MVIVVSHIDISGDRHWYYNHTALKTAYDGYSVSRISSLKFCILTHPLSVIGKPRHGVLGK